ncbi:hypothetical protein DERP_014545 [Dermatophagoides pteronyssinus]|uniref:Uncharacterized protein n=1 Tax=Dermatophagoides pteronyssinus TaxID=6956 RepID=A0ABQ8J1R5_DERPT|nr:hypothetical protein DERP_014545 [Dermatophagoides pteronyssinus]
MRIFNAQRLNRQAELAFNEILQEIILEQIEYELNFAHRQRERQQRQHDIDPMRLYEAFDPLLTYFRQQDSRSPPPANIIYGLTTVELSFAYLLGFEIDDFVRPNNALISTPTLSSLARFIDRFPSADIEIVMDLLLRPSAMPITLRLQSLCTVTGYNIVLAQNNVVKMTIPGSIHRVTIGFLVTTEYGRIVNINVFVPNRFNPRRIIATVVDDRYLNEMFQLVGDLLPTNYSVLNSNKITVPYHLSESEQQHVIDAFPNLDIDFSLRIANVPHPISRSIDMCFNKCVNDYVYRTVENPESVWDFAGRITDQPHQPFKIDDLASFPADDLALIPPPARASTPNNSQDDNDDDDDDDDDDFGATNTMNDEQLDVTNNTAESTVRIAFDEIVPTIKGAGIPSISFEEIQKLTSTGRANIVNHLDKTTAIYMLLKLIHHQKPNTKFVLVDCFGASYRVMNRLSGIFNSAPVIVVDHAYSREQLHKFDISSYRIPFLDRRQRQFTEEIGSSSSTRDLNHHLNVIIHAIVEDLIKCTKMNARTRSIVKTEKFSYQPLSIDDIFDINVDNIDNNNHDNQDNDQNNDQNPIDEAEIDDYWRRRNLRYQEQRQAIDAFNSQLHFNLINNNDQ